MTTIDGFTKRLRDATPLRWAPRDLLPPSSRQGFWVVLLFDAREDIHAIPRQPKKLLFSFARRTMTAQEPPPPPTELFLSPESMAFRKFTCAPSAVILGNFPFSICTCVLFRAHLDAQAFSPAPRCAQWQSQKSAHQDRASFTITTSGGAGQAVPCADKKTSKRALRALERRGRGGGATRGASLQIPNLLKREIRVRAAASSRAVGRRTAHALARTDDSRVPAPHQACTDW